MNYARKARIATLVVSLAVGVSEFAAPPAHVIKMPEPVRGRYVVVLKGVASAEASNVSDVLLRSVGGHKRFVFRNALVAFSADLNEEQATRLTYSPLVQSVEEVALVHVSDRQPLPSSNLLWHLDRIDQHYLPLDNVFDYCERGSDVYAYMVDTGINREHQDFSF